MNKLLLLGMLLTYPYLACCQIWVEITSRGDTFAILGSNSDNKVRIHNLPDNAKVEVEHGKAIRIDGGNFVLCKFSNETETILTVKQSNKVIYSKKYRIYHSDYSGTFYNPKSIDNHTKINVRLGNLRIDGGHKIDKIRLAMKEGLYIDNNDCNIVSVTATILKTKLKYIPPLNIVCQKRSSCNIDDSLQTILLNLIQNGHIINFNNILLQCKSDKPIDCVKGFEIWME